MSLILESWQKSIDSLERSIKAHSHVNGLLLDADIPESSKTLRWYTSNLGK